MSAEVLHIDSSACIGCAACVAACPVGALAMRDGLAVVNETCTACAICLAACPAGALSLREGRAQGATLDAHRGVWVWIEQSGGMAHPISWEMMGQGRRLADDLGVELTACVFGHGVGSIARQAIHYGADRALLVEHPALTAFRTEPYSLAMVELCRTGRPEVLLLGASSRGRDLAGSVATRLGTGLTADCTQLEVDRQTRGLLQTRPAYGGNIMATIITPRHRPQMATVRHRVFEAPTPDLGRTGAIVSAPIDLGAAALTSEILEFVRSDERMNLADAHIIVSGGAGVGGPDGFAPLRDLAEALGGAVGASRAAVDAGWIPQAHQVGQTGRTVRPDLYIACGISGAIQHQAGMSTARVIVAINTDPHAPIFDIATYGIVGDCLQVARLLTEQLSQMRRRLRTGG